MSQLLFKPAHLNPKPTAQVTQPSPATTKFLQTVCKTNTRKPTAHLIREHWCFKRFLQLQLATWISSGSLQWATARCCSRTEHSPPSLPPHPIYSLLYSLCTHTQKRVSVEKRENESNTNLSSISTSLHSLLHTIHISSFSASSLTTFLFSQQSERCQVAEIA